MYEEFEVADRWTGETLHCKWRANIVAIATRHADAVDVRLLKRRFFLWLYTINFPYECRPMPTSWVSRAG